VRVDQTESATGTGIRQGEVQQIRRFPGAGLPDQIEVVHPVGEMNAERVVAILVAGNAERGVVNIHEGMVTNSPILS
jgi:hypothetical protein